MSNNISSYVSVCARLQRVASGIIEYFNDERMSRCKLLQRLSERLDRPPSAIAHFFLLSSLAILLWNPCELSSIITNSLALLPGIYMTVKYFIQDQPIGSEIPPLTPGFIKKEYDNQRKEQLKKLLDYWQVYSTSLIFEDIVSWSGEGVESVFPLWWVVKAAIIVYALMSIGANGERKEVHKPKPLRLQPRAKVNQRSQLFKDPSPEPEVLGSAAILEKNQGMKRRLNATKANAANDDGSEGTTAVDSALPAQVRARGSAVNIDDSPFVTSSESNSESESESDSNSDSNSELGSEHSPPFTLSAMTSPRSPDDMSNSESESDTDSASPESPDDHTNSDSESDSGVSDDSNDIAILPPDMSNPIIGIDHQVEADESHVPDAGLKVDFPSAASSAGMGKSPVGDGVSYTSNGVEKPTTKVGEDKPSPSDMKTGNASSSFDDEDKGVNAEIGEEGSVTRLSLDQLLALEGEGEEEAEVVVAMRGERVGQDQQGGTKPLVLRERDPEKMEMGVGLAG